MIAPLVRKELREHRLGFLVLGLITAAGFAVIYWSLSLRDETGTPFSALRIFLYFFAPLCAAVLGRSLIVKEYAGHTQLFLEALPASRLAVALVKFVIGLGVLLLIVGVVFGFTLVLALPAVQPRLAGIVALRTVLFVLFWFSFFFAAGFLGRYRVPIYIALTLTVFALNVFTKFEVERVAPFALVDETFAFERHHLALEPARTTLLLALGLAALGFLLAIVREGSIAGRMAEKMSHREKVFIAMALLGAFYAFIVYEERTVKKPFNLSNAITVQGRDVTIKFDSGAESDTAQQFAERVHAEIIGVREFLALPSLPPVFITTRSDLDAEKFELGKIEQAEGLLARINFASPSWRDEAFLRWLIRELLAKRYPLPESKRWVLDGFADYWLRRNAAGEPILRDRQLALRALHGTRAGLTSDTLKSWLTFREEVGDEIARAVAWSGLKSMARVKGEQRTRYFLRAVLGPDLPKDFRATLHEWRSPIGRLLATHSGISPENFIAAWRQELAAARSSLAGDLGRVAQVRGQVEFVLASPLTRKLKYRVVSSSQLPAATRVSFLYDELPPLNAEIELPEIVRDARELPQAQAGVELAATFTRGTRLLWTLAIESPELGCEIISGWTRQEVP